jgi:hypothetical protein
VVNCLLMGGCRRGTLNFEAKGVLYTHVTSKCKLSVRPEPGCPRGSRSCIFGNYTNLELELIQAMGNAMSSLILIRVENAEERGLVKLVMFDQSSNSWPAAACK